MASIKHIIDLDDLGKEDWKKNRNKEVELLICCRNITKQCNPLVVMYLQEQGSKEWKEMGRTEVITRETNPQFLDTIRIQYTFEKRQNLLFKLYGDSVSVRTYLGEALCTLGQIVKRNWRKYEAHLLNESEIVGDIIINPEEVSSCGEIVHMTWRGHVWENSGNKIDPILVLSRCNEEAKYLKCYKTDPVKNSRTPAWKPIVITMQRLCNDDEERPIKFEMVNTYKPGGVIGEFTTKLSKLKKTGNDNSFECGVTNTINGKGVYKATGTLNIANFKIERPKNVNDYIGGGTDLNFVVAIDFTSSNGDPSEPDSLHSQGGKKISPYALAIQAVGEILEDYNSDKKFPAYGFGARTPPRGKISHLFPLNFDESYPECHKIEGVLKAYQECLEQVELAGPTILAPTVEKVLSMASKTKDASQYFVLLIITDGVLTDMDATKAAIVRASKYPVSIIIVGVGKGNFDALVELDGDDERLSYQGKKAERDIVQFVPLRKFLSKDRTEIQNKVLLAQAVLEEVPDQLLGYMNQHNLPPIYSKD